MRIKLSTLPLLSFVITVSKAPVFLVFPFLPCTVPIPEEKHKENQNEDDVQKRIAGEVRHV